MLVATGHDLEEQHRPRPADRQVADLVDQHETGDDERADAVSETALRLRVLE
jgi:hypothetical protein